MLHLEMYDRRWLSGGDTDYLFRAYLAGFTLEYVPDMAVSHHHGRKTPAEGRKLLRGYLIANGAEYAKYGRHDLNLCRSFYWDCKNALKEMLAGGISTTSLAYFSHRDKVIYAVLGAVRYFFVWRHHSARTVWDDEAAIMGACPAPPLERRAALS